MASGAVAEAPPARGSDPIRWGRWTPSLLDCFFLAVLVWLFAAGADGWSGLLADADAGWHIRAGEYILDHHRVPVTDLFSFSKPEAPWYAWEWLSDVGLAFLHRAWGLKGVALAAGVVIALGAALLLWHLLWRGANAVVALLVALVAVGASTMHYLARPHVVTLLLLVGALWLVDRDRRQPGRAVWLLIPLAALWTNLHGGFVALLACLVLLALGSAAEALWTRPAEPPPGRPARRYALLAALCGLATLANPYGYRLHVHIGDYLRSAWIRNLIQEFQAPGFRRENELYFEAVLLVSLALVAPLVARRRVVEPLWILFWAHQALGSARHIPIFVIVVAPIAASEISCWWRILAGGWPRRSVLGILGRLSEDMASGFRRTSVWAPLLALVVIAFNPYARWPADFPAQMFPVQMVAGHEPLVGGARVLTSDQWGDYLIYRFYPKQRVFVDGRSDFYGPQIGDQYLHLVYARADWQQLLTRYGFDVVLSPAEWPLASLLKMHPGWRLVAQDKLAVLFARASSPSPNQTEALAPGTKDLAMSGEGLMKTTDSAERQKGDRTRR